jgi:hypothetical protein
MFYNLSSSSDALDALTIQGYTPVLNQTISSNTKLPTHSSPRFTLIFSHTQHPLPQTQCDLLAIRPLCEKTWNFACQNPRVDLISLDLSSRLPFYIKRPQINQAISNGIYFEINLENLWSDAASKRHLIANALQLIRATQGRRLILTLGSVSASHVRSPMDIIHLASVFGLSADQAKLALSKNPHSCLLQAASKRHSLNGILSQESLLVSKLPFTKKRKFQLDQDDNEPPSRS